MKSPALDRIQEESARYSSIIPAAVLIVRGPGGGPTFVRQKGGPFAGRWLLPGGGIEVGEPAHEAAVRETYEETGIVVPARDVRVVGIYEILGRHGMPYHVLMSAFITDGTYELPTGFVGDNGGAVTQSDPDGIVVHSSDRRILTHAGVVADSPAVTEAAPIADWLEVRALA